MKHILCILTAMTLVAIAQEAPQIPEGWFAFTVDARVLSSESLGSVEFLNPSKATDRIVVNDGHFMTASGSPVRFFGSNLCFNNAFPEKELAPRLAGRMKQMGFNIIRFHHRLVEPSATIRERINPRHDIIQSARQIHTITGGERIIHRIVRADSAI